MNNKYSVFISVIAICLPAFIGASFAGELDGKMAVCNFKKEELFVKFSGDKVTQLEVISSKKINPEYEFYYSDVEIKEEVNDAHIGPKSIFWSNILFRSGAENINSIDDVEYAALAGGVGRWVYIDRTTLVAKSGMMAPGVRYDETGNCKLSDENGEVEFMKKYQDLKRASKDEFNKRLEQAKTKVDPKL